MFEFLAPNAPSLPSLLLAFGAVVIAYLVFTLAGFGSALFASGPLAQALPVQQVVPILALLDCAGSSLRGWRARRQLHCGVLLTLLPGMLAGQILGVSLLSRIPTQWMALALGLYVLSQGIQGLLAPWRSASATSNVRHGWMHGLAGGLIGGMFGSGGILYAAYAQRRMGSEQDFRPTVAVLLALSTAWRIALCLIAGLLNQHTVVWALLFVPAMATGIFLGQRIDVRLRRQHLILLLNGLLLLSGFALVLRAFE